MFSLGNRSLQRLEGVHPDLVKLVHRAIRITEIDFTVLEGLRSKETQAHYVAAGKSRTMNSRHLTGHAVDLGAWVNGTVSWQAEHYTPIAEAMKKASEELNVPIVWGGDWKTFKDLVHFELHRADYPA